MSYLNGKFEFYNQAIEHAKSLKDDSWALEEKVIPFLNRINSSEYIRTLYSKFGCFLEGEGYLDVCYVEEIENSLIEVAIPRLKKQFCDDDDTQLICDLNDAKIGQRDKTNVSPSLLFINNPEYWNVKHIRFRLKKKSIFNSEQFWEGITSELERLSPESET